MASYLISKTYIIVATLLLAGCGGNKTETAEKAAPEATAKVAEVKCSGINSCKGSGACGKRTGFTEHTLCSTTRIKVTIHTNS